MYKSKIFSFILDIDLQAENVFLILITRNYFT